ncbi:hypothetical protein [Candidatus Protochlamydia amoebophila]|jgi:hypothetical protein|uniref:Uncharacterized protein n=1 Tax=Candidatus Protochlamydia amoebophila TaxID=362787 RepID=A0A0C1H101_9BACT|nr:hypothetical protein [Candidatus Protochlamydia amoebophila]KIC71419.1 hypothetical protein DB44_DT00540 [Candidatus Protochlamydia amoebophila]
MSEEAEKLIQENAKEIDSHDEQMAKRRNKKKIKATIYLTEEAEQAFTELYIHRLRKDRKIDRSIIACDAIMDLYEKECCKPN